MENRSAGTYPRLELARLEVALYQRAYVIGLDWFGSRACAWLANAANVDAVDLLEETEEGGLSDAATLRALRRLRRRVKELGYRRVELRDCIRNPSRSCHAVACHV